MNQAIGSFSMPLFLTAPFCCDEMKLAASNWIISWSNPAFIVVFSLGVPTRNQIRYCPFCGKEIGIDEGESISAYKEALELINYRCIEQPLRYQEYIGPEIYEIRDNLEAAIKKAELRTK